MSKRARPLVLTALALAACRAPAYPPPETVSQERWGRVGDRPVSSYTLVNANGLRVRITDYGAAVTHFVVPDRDGRFDDVVLGFDSVADYVDRSPYFGCTAGRCANRIAGARFELDGREHVLAANDPPHHLHGGVRGFDKVVWESEMVETVDGFALRLWYDSPDGEEGYPGNVHAEVVYRLTDEDELVVEMTATTDAPTPVNLVHHTYWNLAGHDSGDVLGQELQLAAARYTPGAPLVPGGAIEPVAGTPFDFTERKPIGRDLGALPPGEHGPGGYDVNYVVDGAPGELQPVALAYDPGSGRTLELFSDQPGVQLYTGNFLDGVRGKGGARYRKHAGFCLESQAFPDAIHHEGEPGWPSVVLRPGETYRHVMVHRFGTYEGGTDSSGVGAAVADMVGPGSIDINIRIPKIKPIIRIDLPPMPGLPSRPVFTSHYELVIRKVHCYESNDDDFPKGGEDHLRVEARTGAWAEQMRLWGYQVHAKLDLGKYRDGTSRGFRAPLWPEADKEFVVIFIERDRGIFDGDDPIGTFRFDPQDGTLTARSATRVWQPDNKPPGTWAVECEGSGGDYQVLVQVRASSD